MRNNKLMQDIDYLLQNQPQKHKNLHSLISRKDLIRIANDVKSVLDRRDFKTKDFSVVLLKIFAKIKDVHTIVDRSREPRTPYSFDYNRR